MEIKVEATDVVWNIRDFLGDRRAWSAESTSGERTRLRNDDDVACLQGVI